MIILLKAIGILLLVDFITGVVHWLEDSFWSPNTPILGKWLVEPNLAHHKNGQEFLKKSYLQSSWDLLFIGGTLLLIAYFTHHLRWEIWLFVILASNANQIHKWAHITRDTNKPKIINWLQKIYILQSTKHHGQHHRKPNDTHFCTVTNLLNPILDKTNFWRHLEYVLSVQPKK